MKYCLMQVFSLGLVIALAAVHAEGKKQKLLKVLETKLNNVLDALTGLQSHRDELNEQFDRIETFMHKLNGTCCSAVEPSDEVQQWVSRVTDFSSQYNDNRFFSYANESKHCLKKFSSVQFNSLIDVTQVAQRWGAKQVVGHPNVYPNYGDLHGTWASKVKDANQFIEVVFAEAVFITGIDIYETYHAGGVTAISGKDESGTWHLLWTTDHAEVIGHSRIFSPPLQIPDVAIKYIRIDVDCTVSGSWVEIDAVLLKGTWNNPNE